MILFSYFFLLILTPLFIITNWGLEKITQNRPLILFFISINFWAFLLIPLSKWIFGAFYLLVGINVFGMKLYQKDCRKIWYIIFFTINGITITATSLSLHNHFYYHHIFEHRLNMFIVFPIVFITLFMKIFSLWLDIINKKQTSLDVMSSLSYLTYFPSIVSAIFIPFDQFITSIRQKNIELQFSKSLFLIAIGLFKMIFLVAPFSPYLTEGFRVQGVWLNNLEVLFSILSVVFFFYFLFSALSDLSRGVSMILGIELPANFKSTLRVVNIKEFIGHSFITLGLFFQRYLFSYIWCENYRKNKFFQHLFFNILVVLIFGVLMLKVSLGLYLLWGMWGIWKKFQIELPNIISKIIFYFSMGILLILVCSINIEHSWMMIQGLVGYHGFALPDVLLKLSIFKSLSPYIDFCSNSGELGYINGNPELYGWIFLAFFIGHLGVSADQMVKNFKANLLNFLFTTIVLIICLIYLFNVTLFDPIGVPYV